MCEKGSGLGGSFGGQSGISLPSGASQLEHMFRDDAGHIPDTPTNRQAIVELVNNADNKIGMDDRNLVWYAKIEPDGSQLWASVFKDVVQNCGRNNPPREWDNKTGLSRNIKKAAANIFKERS